MDRQQDAEVERSNCVFIVVQDEGDDPMGSEEDQN